MADPAPRRSSLRTRVLLVVAVLAGVLLLTSVGTVLGQQRSAAADARVSRQALPALVAVERWERAFVEEQDAVRGFLLTGSEAVLEPYRAAGAVIAAQEEVLRGGPSEVVFRVDAVSRAHRAWSDVAEPGVVGQADVDRMAALSGTLRSEVAGLRAAVEQRLARDVAEADAVRMALSWLLSAAVVVAVVCVVLAAVGVRRWVSRPLAALVDAVEGVAGGDLDRPVPVTGPAEVAAVGGAVDRMRVLLGERRAAAAGASEGVSDELRDGVLRRLSGIGAELAAVVGRHPTLVGELRGPADELGRAIRDLGVPAPTSALAVRVVEALARVPEQLGVRADVRVDGAAGREVPVPTADELLGALDRALDGLVETRARLDGLEVELAVDADEAALSLIARGIVPGEWTADVRGVARRWPGACRVVDLDPELAVVEWSLPLR